LDKAAVLVAPDAGAAGDSKPVEEDPESKKPRVDDSGSSSSSSGGGGSGNNNNADLFVPFEQCLSSFFAAETVDLFNPTVQRIVPCLKTTRFKTFPRYLMVKLGTYCMYVSYVVELYVDLKSKLSTIISRIRSLLCGAQLGASEDQCPGGCARVPRSIRYYIHLDIHIYFILPLINCTGFIHRYTVYIFSSHTYIHTQRTEPRACRNTWERWRCPKMSITKPAEIELQVQKGA
jgi:hypothetical protein